LSSALFTDEKEGAGLGISSLLTMESQVSKLFPTMSKA
jgi:hypothetical protein